ncbi:RND transporter, partial [Burkholderia multivorans]
GVPIRALGAPTLLYDTFVGQLQASYTIDLFGAARFANRSLANRVDVSAFQLESARRALAANIVTAAITVSVLDAQIDTTERLVALANDQARDAERRHALGAAARSDALSARQNADTFAASL